MAASKTYATRPSTGLWGSVAVTGWIFIVISGILALGYAYQTVLLAGMNPMEPMGEFDPIPGHDGVTLAVGLMSLLYAVAFVVGAVLTLRWYLRSIRNAHVLHRGISVSPGWVVWYFIIPIVSLIRPYTMTSELWRSSLKPEGWRGLKDPAMLRWWWGLVLGSNFSSVIASFVGRAARTVGEVMVLEILTVIGFVLAAAAGLLFLRIGGPISRRQTALIEAGHRPAEGAVPAWSA